MLQVSLSTSCHGTCYYKKNFQTAVRSSRTMNTHPSSEKRVWSQWELMSRDQWPFSGRVDWSIKYTSVTLAIKYPMLSTCSCCSLEGEIALEVKIL